MPVTYDALGPSGWAYTTATTASATWTHTVGSANLVVVICQWGTGTSDCVNDTRTITYDGVAMTSLGWLPSAIDGRWGNEFFYLLNPPSGAKTVVATSTGSSQTRWVNANSVSFLGAKAPVRSTNTGSSSSASVSVSSAVGSLVLGMASVWPVATVSAVNGTSLWIDNVVGVAHIGSCYLSGAATVTPTATLSSSQPWAMTAVEIAAAPPQFFSMF